ncbi:MAG: ABC transporter ATP-binding protein [Candidatus Eisenbacteria bacterium]|nr:ABC transporter ATP-binding protein [Candidatus Eisenbacteria bacterium]MCC7142845.1 ABC transporter ATP-binding protein [Candidatus Eisenbacteria bacterium]
MSGAPQVDTSGKLQVDTSGKLQVDVEKRFPGSIPIHGRFESTTAGGAITVLFGPSGCGKTTILRCLAGLERPERGSIRFEGESWCDSERSLFVSPQRRGIGYLSQDYALFPHLTALENIRYGLRRLPREESQRRVVEIIDLLHLGGLEQRYPRQLSGGQQQRVAVARAVVRRPRLLLLDEPLSALDAPTREELRRELRRVLQQCAVPAVVVTHDRIEAIALADQIVVLESGQVRQCGSTEEVFSRPADLAVARILGVDTVVPGKIVEIADGLATISVGQADLVALAPAFPGPEVFVCIRAEEVALERGSTAQSSARNHLVGQIVSLFREGPITRVHLDCGFPLAAIVTHQSSQTLGLREGATVTAVLKAPAIHLIGRG